MDYYIAGLIVIGFNPRFIVQLLPFMGIFAASLISGGEEPVEAE